MVIDEKNSSNPEKSAIIDKKPQESHILLEKVAYELKIRGFSNKTLKTYLYYLSKFLKFSNKHYTKINEKDIERFFTFLLYNKNSSPSTISIIKSALKFTFDEVLNFNIVNIKTPKSIKKLPTVLTKNEVKDLIRNAETKKERLIIKFLYSSGVRVSELCKIKINDLELKEGTAWVRHGKGAKDRAIILSQNLIKDLKDYIPIVKSEFLFPGKKGKMSERNVELIINKTSKRANIHKKVTPHTLRHSFATHLLEAGVDIRKIQTLLGHSNLQTTQIYTHINTSEIRKIKSPLDNL